MQAQTRVQGKPMLVATHSDTADAVLARFHAHGDALTRVTTASSLDPWVIRSLLGFGGQSLQLASSFMRPTGKVDPNIFVFAAANLTANAMNLIYRAQTADDPHQLKFLREKINATLAPHVGSTTDLPSVDTPPVGLQRYQNKAKEGGVNAFLRRYSVNIGELGLRYLGAFGLVYDLSWEKLKKNPIPQLTASPLRRYAGLSSIAGKTVALASQIEDPYNPKPKSWIDGVREKFTFLIGGWIEVTSFAALAYDNFFNTNPNNPAQRNRGILWRGTVYRDWLGGIGASMFVTGYIVRSWAKYGVRQVNMDALYAHAGDALASVPPEKAPQLIADLAAQLTEHFSKHGTIDYGTIYSKIYNDYQMVKNSPSQQEAHIVTKPGKAENLRPLATVSAVRREAPVLTSQVAIQKSGIS